MVSGGLQWSSWSPSVSGDLRWSLVVSYGLRWSPVVSGGLRWSSMVSVVSSSLRGLPQSPVLSCGLCGSP